MINEKLVMLYMFLSWIAIWKHSHTIDKRLEDRDGREGLKSLPNDKRLVVYSSTFMFLLTAFYTIIYWQIEVTPSGFVVGDNLTQSIATYHTKIWSIFSMLIGVILTIKSRERLNILNSREVVFALNNKDKEVNDGIYTNMHHPMYVGFILITLSSLLLFPSVLGALILLGAYFCLMMKIFVEKNK